MKKMKILGLGVLPVAMVLLGGCADKTDGALLDTIKKNSAKYNSLKQSEKVIFGAGTESEGIFFITYDSAHCAGRNDTRNSEIFYVSLSPVDSVRLDRLRMQGDIKPLSIRRISRSSLPATIRAPLPSWFTSYRVEFPYVNLKKFSIDAVGSNGEKKRFYFYKVPKYIVEKPEMIGISKP